MLKFLDSFEDRNTNFQYKYDTGFVSSSPISPFRGGQAVQILLINHEYLMRNTFSAQPTVILGFAIELVNPSSSSLSVIGGIMDGTTEQLRLRVNTSRQIEVYNPSTSTILATSSVVMSASGTYYVELKATIHNTTGSFTLRLDGVTAASATGVNTRSSASNQATGFYIGCRPGVSSAGTSPVYDDVYYVDTSGSANNDFLGTIHIECLRPAAAGNSTNWSIGGSATAGANYSSVNDTSPDDDTTYTDSGTVGDKDTFVMSDLSVTSGITIVGTQAGMRMRMQTSGSHDVKRVLRSGGTDYDGTANTVSSTTYQDFLQIDETDPATGAAWLPTAINAVEAGVKTSA